MKEHRSRVHERTMTEFRQVESAHRRAIRVLRLDYPEAVGDVTSALQYSHSHVCSELERESAKCGHFKFNLVLYVEFIKVDESNEVSQSVVVPFRSRVIRALPMNTLDQELTEAYDLIQESVASFVEKGSGWIVDEILHLDVEITKCLDLAGKCYSSHTISWTKTDGFVVGKEGFFPTIKTDKADANAGKLFSSARRNKDCFYIALARHFNRTTTDRQELLDYAAKTFKGIKKSGKPVSIADIDRFERQNPSLAINVVYLDEEDRLLPVRASPRVEIEDQIVLLLLYVNQYGSTVAFPKNGDENEEEEEEEEEEEKEEEEAGAIKAETSQELMHYVCIEDQGAFFGKKVNRTNGVAQKRKRFICFNCFNAVTTKKAYLNHVAWCHLNQNQRIIYPKKNYPVEFNAGFKASMVPFVIFYDFESLQIPVSKKCSCSDDVIAYTEADDETRLRMEHENHLRKSWEGLRTRALRLCPHKTKTVHVQRGFAYHIIAMSREGEVVETREYVGEDAGDKFCDDMLDLDEILTRRMENVLPMRMTKKEEMRAKREKNCWLCRKPLDEEDGVRDHDHLSGKFLGMAHNICNLRRRELKKIVAFSHNFSG